MSRNQYPLFSFKESCWKVENSNEGAANSFCELWTEGVCWVGSTGGDRYFA